MRDIANFLHLIYLFNNTPDATWDSQNNRYYHQEERRDIGRYRLTHITRFDKMQIIQVCTE